MAAPKSVQRSAANFTNSPETGTEHSQSKLRRYIAVNKLR